MWGGEGVDGAEQTPSPPNSPLQPKGLHQFLPSYKSTTAEPLTNKTYNFITSSICKASEIPGFLRGLCKDRGKLGVGRLGGVVEGYGGSVCRG